MADFDSALEQARRLSAAFGMHPSVRTEEIVVTEGDDAAYYDVSPMGEGKAETMTPAQFAQWRTHHDKDDWT